LEGYIVAKLKKTIRNKASVKGNPAINLQADLQAKAEHMSRSIVDSAQHIWMAGMGAFNRAQGEGSKLFEALVKEGMNIEQHTRKLAGGKVDAVRDAVENRVGVARERATDTWDRLEKVFEERVQRALNRLGVPNSEDLSNLVSRVNKLTDAVGKQGGNVKAGAKAAKTKAVKTKAAKSVKPVKAIKKAAKKAVKAAKTVSKPTAKKAAAKSINKVIKSAKAKPRKLSLPQAAKPAAPNA
jgi:poly(hydroxyalkanoate) granule-associated protein